MSTDMPALALSTPATPVVRAVDGRGASSREIPPSKTESATRRRIPRKSERPETETQARTWDKNFSAYKAVGFCPRCASQGAWGHQIGFNLAREVGDCCLGKATPKGYDRAERWANRALVVVS